VLRCLTLCFALAWASGARAQADDPATATTPENAAPPASGAGIHGWADALPEREPTPEEAPSFYVIREGAPVLDQPDGQLRQRLRLRTSLRVLETRGGWSRVLAAGETGWMQSAHLSNLWIRIDKSDRTTYVYRGGELWRELPADVSANPEGDKIRRAGRTESEEHKIPEGTFYVTRLFAESDYYLAFVLSYPTPRHARQGLESGLISQGQYDAIVSAHRDFREPPQGTRLGGLIEIHGHGTGRRRAWTRWCVALRNVHMDDLWEVVHVGTPVVIEP
jgi:hypothetical protein